jgi:hypothetical protein
MLGQNKEMLMNKILFTISYAFVIVGSGGMIAFAHKFPHVTAIWELKHAQERFLCLNGYQVWVYSWLAILVGTIGQIVATWFQT